MKIDLEPAWILHRRPWRESSLLIEAFGRDHGRVALVAKGARGAGSSRRSLLEPFIPLLISWTQRGEMGTLTAAEAAGAPPGLAGRALWCGFYCNELLFNLLARDDAAPGAWRAYSDTLPRLAEPEGQASALRRFEMALLSELGVVPDLTTEAETGAPIVPDGHYALIPESGPRAVAASSTGAIDGKVLLALARGLFDDDESAHAARRVMRVLIDRQLGGRVLRTREMFS